MKSPTKAIWFFTGIAAGLAIAFVWPHEPLKASQAAGNEKFSMCTVNLEALNTGQGVFVLDHLTGQLRGAAFNARAGKFTHQYYRNIAADFNLNPQAANNAKYSMIACRTNLAARVGARPAADCVCIAELTSGKCIMYALPFSVANRPIPKPFPLSVVDAFVFRVN